jgi:hypothetical protein
MTREDLETLRRVIKLAICLSVLLLAVDKASYRPRIPKTWITAELEQMDVPVSQPVYKQIAVSPDYYYRIPVMPIYKSYPVYAPGHAPTGYMERLKRLRPELAFDAVQLKTEQDWLRAGEIVFDAATAYNAVVNIDDLTSPTWYSTTGVPIAKDGTVPWVRYVIRRTGKVEVGNLSCGFCHTRVLLDGSVVKGAQSNFPVDKAISYRDRRRGKSSEVRNTWLQLFTVQWVPDMQRRLERSSIEEILAAHDAIPQGVFARNRSNPFYPPAVPELIGVVNQWYLDRTGSTRHRGITDLMRYASLAQGIEFLSSFGGFIPEGEDNFAKLPSPQSQERFSDEELYALATYLYSLRPPSNPYQMDALAEAGRKVFEKEGCPVCHPPPHYTNNKLQPVTAFEVPPEHFIKYDIMKTPIDTDPRLTLQTRRGTGYYKIPSLRGVWYRSAFEHNGSVATLEDSFDERRLRDDYVPTNFVGFGVKSRAVKGHEFGLRLPDADKKSLIAFLKTL